MIKIKITIEKKESLETVIKKAKQNPFQKLTLKPLGPLGPISPEIPISPYKIKSRKNNIQIKINKQNNTKSGTKKLLI